MKGNIIGYIQCDIEVPEILRENFAKFPPVLKNISVSENDNDDLMKTYAEKERIMTQPRKTLISSLTLQNGTLITPLLLFYLQLGLAVTKNTVLLRTPQIIVSTALYRQQWTQEGKVTKSPIQLSLPRH